MQIKKLSELKKVIHFIVDTTIQENRKVTSKEICKHFSINESTTGWPNTRAIIKEAMRQYAVEAGIPIGATNDGYFMMQTEGEVYKYRDNLHSRIKGMEERVHLAVEAWNKGTMEFCVNKPKKIKLKAK
jgi:hypothetical protein